MSNSKNPLLSALVKFHKRLNTSCGLLYLLESNIRNVEYKIKKYIETNHSTEPVMYSGSRVPFTDLTGPTDNGWLFHYPTEEAFCVADQDYVDAINKAMCQFVGKTIAEMYEAFETFLKDITASYLKINSDVTNAEKQTKFDDSGKSVNLTKGSIKYWRAYVEYCNRDGANNRGIFKMLRKLSPDLRIAETQNVLGVDLQNWYQAVSTVRHAVTHSNYEINDNAWDKLNDNQRILLRKYFSFKTKNAIRYLCITRGDCDKVAEMFAAYGFSIFKSLSIQQGYDWVSYIKGK